MSRPSGAPADADRACSGRGLLCSNMSSTRRCEAATTGGRPSGAPSPRSTPPPTRHIGRLGADLALRDRLATTTETSRREASGEAELARSRHRCSRRSCATASRRSSSTTRSPRATPSTCPCYRTATSRRRTSTGRREASCSCSTGSSPGPARATSTSGSSCAGIRRRRSSPPSSAPIATAAGSRHRLAPLRRGRRPVRAHRAPSQPRGAHHRRRRAPHRREIIEG